MRDIDSSKIDATTRIPRPVASRDAPSSTCNFLEHVLSAAVPVCDRGLRRLLLNVETICRCCARDKALFWSRPDHGLGDCVRQPPPESATPISGKLCNSSRVKPLPVHDLIDCLRRSHFRRKLDRI